MFLVANLSTNHNQVIPPWKITYPAPCGHFWWWYVSLVRDQPPHTTPPQHQDPLQKRASTSLPKPRPSFHPGLWLWFCPEKFQGISMKQRGFCPCLISPVHIMYDNYNIRCFLRISLSRFSASWFHPKWIWFQTSHGTAKRAETASTCTLERSDKAAARRLSDFVASRLSWSFWAIISNHKQILQNHTQHLCEPKNRVQYRLVEF